MDPERFIIAQDPVWAQVLAELSAGRTTTHWMWFVFPQLAALGRSARAKHFGLTGADDARVYDAHAILGPRLRSALTAATGSGETDPIALFGPVDAMKLQSCLTLFSVGADDPAPYDQGLGHFFRGDRDRATLDFLAKT